MNKWDLVEYFSPYEIACFSLEEEPEPISDKIKQKSFWSSKDEDEDFIARIDYFSNRIESKKKRQRKIVLRLEPESEPEPSNDIEHSKRIFTDVEINKYLDRKFSKQKAYDIFESSPLPCPEELLPIEASTERTLYEQNEALRKENQQLQVELKKAKPEHTSELLEYLYQLINEFWINDYKQSNPPTNDTMMAWLAVQDERFNSKNTNQLAKYMAMITRPDNQK